MLHLSLLRTSEIIPYEKSYRTKSYRTRTFHMRADVPYLIYLKCSHARRTPRSVSVESSCAPVGQLYTQGSLSLGAHGGHAHAITDLNKYVRLSLGKGTMQLNAKYASVGSFRQS